MIFEHLKMNLPGIEYFLVEKIEILKRLQKNPLTKHWSPMEIANALEYGAHNLPKSKFNT